MTGAPGSAATSPRRFRPRLLAAAEALATVHAVDWQSAGLDFLLPPAGAVPATGNPNAARGADEAVKFGESKIQNEMAGWRRRAANSPISGASWFVALAD